MFYRCAFNYDAFAVLITAYHMNGFDRALPRGIGCARLVVQRDVNGDLRDPVELLGTGGVLPAADADAGHVESVLAILVPIIVQRLADFANDAGVRARSNQPGICAE